MLLGHRNSVVLALVVCALSTQTVLAKKHPKPHKPSSKTSAGTVTMGGSRYEGTNTVILGTLVPAADPYQGLIISSGYEALIANPPQSLVLAPLYPSGSIISFGGTATVNNAASLVSSGTIISTGTLNLSPSAGVLSVDLGNSSISAGTLLVSNSVNHSGVLDLTAFQQSLAGITLSAFSNYVIPSDTIVVSSGTLTLNAPEPSCLGLAALASLAFLRRPSRK
jgi:hypothetical protein